jgi:hypothetical protein
MHLRFSIWHQLLLAFGRPFKLGEILGAIAVFAVSLRICTPLAQPLLDPAAYPGFWAIGVFLDVWFVLSFQLVYWVLYFSIRRGEVAKWLTYLPDKVWALVETETGLIPMADTGIHALVFQSEEQTEPWLAQYPDSISPQCVDRDRTLSAFQNCGVKWIVYYHGDCRTTWMVLPLISVIKGVSHTDRNSKEKAESLHGPARRRALFALEWDHG